MMYCFLSCATRDLGPIGNKAGLLRRLTERGWCPSLFEEVSQ